MSLRQVLVSAVLLGVIGSVAACGGSDKATVTGTVKAGDTEISIHSGGKANNPDAAPQGAPPPQEAVIERCLQGNWEMSVTDTSTLFGALLPLLPVEAEGTIKVAFDGRDVTQQIDVDASFTVPTGSIEGSLNQTLVGTYEVSGGVVSIRSTAVEGGWTQLKSTIGGISVDIPSPPSEIPSFTGGPVVCNDKELRVGYAAGVSGAIARFSRV